MLTHWTPLSANDHRKTDPTTRRDRAAVMQREVSEERAKQSATILMDALRQIADSGAGTAPEKLRAIASDALETAIERRGAPRTTT